MKQNSRLPGFYAAILFLNAFLACVCASYAVDEAWGTYGHDARRSFTSSGSVDGPLTKLWIYTSPDGPARAIMADRNAVYMNRLSSMAYTFCTTRIDTNGALVWNGYISQDADGGHTPTFFEINGIPRIVMADDGVYAFDLSNGNCANLYQGDDIWGETLADEDRLYVVNSTRVHGPPPFVSAIDHWGNILWYQNYFAAYQFCNPAALALDHGSLFLAAGYSGGAETSGVYSLESATGNLRWFAQTTPGSSISAGDGRVYLWENDGAGSKKRLTARSQTDGKVLWQTVPITLGAGNNLQSPVLASNLVIVGLTDAVKAFSATNGALVWSAPVPGIRRELAAALGSGAVVAIADDGIHILDLAIGAGRWLEGGSGYYDPVIVGRRLYARTSGGGVVAFQSGAGSQVVPCITTEPVGVTKPGGQSASFSVVASGSGTLYYQWQKNGADIPGANSTTCTTPPVTPDDNGASFRVTVWNNAGIVKSHSAVLHVPGIVFSSAPAEWSTVSGTFDVAGTASDELNPINCMFNGQTRSAVVSPFSFTWDSTAVPDGVKYVSLIGYFNGYTVSTNRYFFVSNTGIPVCRVTGGRDNCPEYDKYDNRSPMPFVVTFSETVTGLTAAGFSVSNGTVNSLSGSGTSYTLLVTPTAPGAYVYVTVLAGAVTDVDGNGNPASAMACVRYDTTAPTTTIYDPSVTQTRHGPVYFSVYFSGANLVTLTSEQVTLNATGTATGTVTVSSSGFSSTVTISDISGTGTLGISIPAGAARDYAGNLSPAAGPSATCAVDNSLNYAPVIRNVAVTPNPAPVRQTVMVIVDDVDPDLDSDRPVYVWNFGDGNSITGFQNSALHAYAAEGTYAGAVSVNDHGVAVTSSFTVVVSGQPPANQAPVVAAGPDVTVTFPSPLTVSGTITDDGLPNPPGAITTIWSKVSGPGTVTFASPGARTTSVAFSSPGRHILRLTAGDGAAESYDDLVVTVLAGSSLVLDWKLDDGEGTQATDSSPYANNGSLAGGPEWTSGQVNGALSFDGIDDYIAVSKVANLITVSVNYSIAAWIKVASLPANRAWIALLGREGIGSHHWTIDSSGNATFGSWGRSSLHPSLPVGQWTHVAMTFDGITLKCYVNGALIGSTNTSFSLYGTIPFDAARAHNGENYFHGLLDDIRIYNRELTATEVASLGGGFNSAPFVCLSVAPSAGFAPVTVNFSAAGSFDPDGAIASYAWDFGDGQGGTGPAITTSHIYTTAGSYPVVLTVTDNLGASNSVGATVTVLANGPADVNVNGMADTWEVRNFGEIGADPGADADGDGYNNLYEYIAGTDPKDPNSCLSAGLAATGGVFSITFQTHSATGPDYLNKTRSYSIENLTNMMEAAGWSALPGLDHIAATDEPVSISVPAGQPATFFRVRVTLE